MGLRGPEPKPKLPCCWCSYLREKAALPLKMVRSLGRCNTCYQFRTKHGFDRTLEMIEAEIERELMRVASNAQANFGRI